MKKMLFGFAVLALSGCAHVNQPSKDQRFVAYRDELKAERIDGRITGVQEQEKLRDRYWQTYGKDSESAWHFAFSMSLMRSAEAGRFPMQEAEALVDARQEQLLAAKKPKPKPFTWDGDTLKNFDQYEY